MSGTVFPSNPTVGQQFTTSSGQTFTWDGTAWTATPSAAQFLALSGGTMTGPITLAGPPAAQNQPVSLAYMQQNAGADNVGRNLVHNALFNIQQRGAGPWTTSSSYTVDRFQLNFVSDTDSLNVVTASDATRAATGDEATQYIIQNVVAGNAAAGAFSQFIQRIENVRRLGGKTVIVSFWASASTAGLRLGVSLDQVFGTGGSPSAQVNGNGQAVTLTGTLTRYSLTFAIASTAGATLGTAVNDNTCLNFWFSSGTNFATRTGNIGVQSGTFSLWGVQLEIAQPGQTAPTPLEKLDPVLQLQQCQRFYLFSQYPFNTGFNSWATGAFIMETFCFPVPLRATPTISLGASSNVINVSGVNSTDMCPLFFQAQVVAAAAGAASIGIAGYTASADL